MCNCCNIESASPTEVRAYTTIRGDTFATSVRTRFDGVPEMLGEQGVVRLKIWNEDNTAIQKSFFAEDQSEDGYVNIVLTPAETEELNGLYEYEVEFRFSSELVVTALRGTLNVKTDHILPPTI